MRWYESLHVSLVLAILTLSQLKSYNVPIIGGKDCDKVSQTPKHGETFTIGEGIKVKALHTPCHTQDSICFLMEDGKDRAVFTGDTLFIGGVLKPYYYACQIMLMHLVQAAVDSLKAPRHRWTRH